MTSSEDQVLLRETDVAQRLNVSVASLRRWRSKGQGPTFLKLGENSIGNPGVAVRYRAKDISSWLNSLESNGSGVAA